MKNVLLFLLLGLVCMTCMENKSAFLNTWKIEAVEDAPGDSLSQNIYPDAELSFYDDGQVSLYQKFEDHPRKPPLYLTGTWTEYGAGLRLTLDSLGFSKKIEIQSQSLNRLTFIVVGDADWDGALFTCRSNDFYKSRSYDLLKPINNTWRVKPHKKESIAEIEARVLHHVQYLVGYFQVIEDKEQTYFETTIIQTPVKFHLNGLALVDGFAKREPWLSYFYDKQDAIEGGKMLIKSLRSIDKYPVSEESLTAGYRDAFKIMEKYLKE